MGAQSILLLCTLGSLCGMPYREGEIRLCHDSGAVNQSQALGKVLIPKLTRDDPEKVPSLLYDVGCSPVK